MLTKQQVQDWLNEYGMIQNIGQIDTETKKALDRAVHKGRLTKSRIPWLGCYGPLKTTYRLT